MWVFPDPWAWMGDCSVSYLISEHHPCWPCQQASVGPPRACPSRPAYRHHPGLTGTCRVWSRTAPPSPYPCPLATEPLRLTGGTNDFWPQSFYATPIGLMLKYRIQPGAWCPSAPLLRRLYPYLLFVSETVPLALCSSFILSSPFSSIFTMVLVRNRQYRQTARLMLLIQFLKGTFLPCTLLVIACMAWFRRRQGYLSCDYFSVTPVFRTESMLLLKFTCIFLKAPSRKQSFFIFTCRALVKNRTLMISCLCNVLFTGLQHDTTLDSLSALDREISLKNIRTYKQTWPEASCTKLTYLGKFQFYLNRLKHRQY